MPHSRPHLPRSLRARCTAIAVAAATLVAVFATVHPVPAAAGSARYSVDIRRTSYGVPHILAGDVGSLGYGFGYAFAQDNACAMEDDVVTLRGQRSKFFGPDATSSDPTFPGTNLDSDFYYRSVITRHTVERLVAQPAPMGPTTRVRQLVTGYAAGFNRYLSDRHYRLTDPACSGAAWVRPITTVDVYRRVYQLTTFLGAEVVKNGIAEAQPPTPGATAPLRPRSLRTLRHLLPSATKLGSNGIALGSAGSNAGDGMVLANPHFPWRGINRFYEVQLTIPGQMNVEGAGLYGLPVVEIGHTRSLAWTHTVSTAQRFTLYQLQLASGAPTHYLVDGHDHAMTATTVTVPTTAADGTAGHVIRTLYSTVYGPVVTMGPLGWSSDTAFAVADANVGNMRLLNEELAMDHVRSIPDLRRVQDRWQALPFVNTIAADAAGRAYYADASVAPNVTDAEARRCVDSPYGQALYPDVTVLDGSTSTCQWGNDADALTHGIFGPAEMPHLTRADYVENSNDSAWLTNPSRPLTGYPRIIGDVGTPRSLRTRLALKMIGERVSGGTTSTGFTLRQLQQLQTNNRVLSAEMDRDAAVTMCRAQPVVLDSAGEPVEVSAACSVLASWDAHGNATSRGEILWRQFWNRARFAGGGVYSTPFDPSHPVATPAGFNGNNLAVQQALGDAVAAMNAAGVPLDVATGAVQRVTTASWPIPLGGCSDGEGCFDILAPGDGPLTADGYPDVDDGASYVAAVELRPSGPVSRSVLAYSESTDSTSPYHLDQTRLFAQKGWLRDAFTEQAIAADPHLLVTHLNA